MRFKGILLVVGVCLCVLSGMWAPSAAQRAGPFMGSKDDPAIRYSSAPLNNVVVDANRKLQEGSIRMAFEGRSGFLRAALEALQLPVDSQLLVFTHASLQGKRISEQNPRALFFNDRVVLGWVRDGELIEVAAHDASAGVVFYTLEQRTDAAAGPPQFNRALECLGCHQAADTLGVPGLLLFSTARPAEETGLEMASFVNQNNPLRERFGGWFVTGSAALPQHKGNNASSLDGRATRTLTTVQGLFDPEGYPASSSDIVAHLVFSHQTRMTNLLTRASWEARASDPTLHPPFKATSEQQAGIAVMMDALARDVVDYLLFVDEAKLTEPVHGGSGFAERFASIGPRDQKGRSLHELDLNRRLMKYPCSYLIYSPPFDALPLAAKEPIYKRMWEVLSGQERDARYQTALSLADRRAIVEILRDTKKDLPRYFQGAVK
jgi:hypothetical protein